MLSLLRHVCGLLGAGGTQFTDMRATLASALFQSPQLPFAHVTHSPLLLGASMGQALSGGITVKWLMNSILPQCPPDTWEIPPSLSCQKEEKQTVPLLSLSNSLSLLTTSGGHQHVCYIHIPLGNEAQVSPLTGTPTLTTDYR